MGWLADPPPPPVDRQTPVKTVPSRRTTYAGGNKKVFINHSLFVGASSPSFKIDTSQEQESPPA